MNDCPQCETRGRVIKRVTLESQVVDDRLDAIGDRDDWRLCLSATCDVIYFRDDEIVVRGETRAAPFHKSEDPDRLVCFCFEHSVAEVEADARANGNSTIRDTIKAACKAGEDDCERINPQGRCCLGNVGLVVKRALPGALDGASDSCCESEGSS